MKDAFSWDRFDRLPVIGILRGFSCEQIDSIVPALTAGGLCNIEVTMNSPGAPDLIRQIRHLAGDSMNVGAGTVCTLRDLETASEAGASFIVTPVLVPEVIEACKRDGVPVVPGAYTPTEIHQAWNLGADLVKVFPADQLGPSYIRSVLAPLPDIRLVPTGGVTVETLASFVEAGAAGFGVGSPLFHPSKVKAGDWAWIETQTRRFVEAYREARVDK